MSARAALALKYAAFCGVAMGLNLFAQWMAEFFLGAGLAVAMALGTGVGLLAKYVLDRNYIFRARGVSASTDAGRFVVYTALGALTTAVFWLTEWAFAVSFSHPSAKYAGGALGLSVGYLLKYQMDRRWVFGVPSAA